MVRTALAGDERFELSNVKLRGEKLTKNTGLVTWRYGNCAVREKYRWEGELVEIEIFLASDQRKPTDFEVESSPFFFYK